MMKIGKKGAVYGVITLMLCTAVYLNWTYANEPIDMTVANQATEEGSSKIYGETKLVDGVEEENTQDVSQTEQDVTETIDVDDYFSSAKLSRDKARDEAISILKTTVDNENATEQSKTDANNQISTLAQNALKEATIESLVIAKGYEDVVVFLNDDGVNVIVSAPEAGFSSIDANKIKDIVLNEAEVTSEQIKIVEAS